MGEGTELCAQPACVRAYPGDDPFGRGERLFIAETQYRPAEAFQLGLPKMVPQHDVIPFVDAPVDFEDQPQPFAGEVSEVSADGVLATEPVSVDLCAAKPLPQAALRQTGGLPLIARESCSVPSHDTIIACFGRHISPPLPLGEGLSARERSDRLRLRARCRCWQVQHDGHNAGHNEHDGTGAVSRSRFLDWLEIAAFAAVIRCPRAIPGSVQLFRQEVRYRQAHRTRGVRCDPRCVRRDEQPSPVKGPDAASPIQERSRLQAGAGP